MAFMRCLNGQGGGGGSIEFTAICSSQCGIVIDTQNVSEVKYKYSGKNSTSNSLRINVSNTPKTTATDMYYYGTNVKTISALMSDYADLLSMPEVSGYRYINFNSASVNDNQYVDFQIK